MENHKYEIQGMTCTACASAIERRLNKVEGVTNVSVNFTTEKMQLDFDEKMVNDTIIFEAVNDAGYDVVQPQQGLDAKNDTSPIDNHAAELKRRLIWSLIFTLPLFYLTMGPMVNLPIFGILKGHQHLLIMAFTQLLLTIPVMIIGRHFYQVGFKTLFKGNPNMDTLIAVGTSAAFVYGIFVIYRLIYGFAYQDMALINRYGHDLYFESVAVIITLITLGKFLEAHAKKKTSAAIQELMALAPDEAICLIDGEEVTIPSSEVTVGAIVIVKPGARIPVDGLVTTGQSTVDASMLTGESMPIEIVAGSEVTGGTLNQRGTFTFTASKVGADTALAKIIEMVENAQSAKAPIAKLADQISAYFVPTVLIISVVAFVSWMGFGYGFEFAFRAAVTILVISCPCALGLATPTAIMVGTGNGAKQGTLFKNGEAIESMQQVDTIIFDKTGTLTSGVVSVTDITAIDNLAPLLTYAGSLEQASEHPLSQAITNYVKEQKSPLHPVSDFEAIVGHGVIGKVDNKVILIGNATLMEKHHIDANNHLQTVEAYASQGKTAVMIAYDGHVQGIIALADTIKDNAASAIRQLKSMNIDVFMVTGDHQTTANAIGKSLDLDGIYAQVLPDGKANIVDDLQNKGKKVLMVGDGINDAVALTSAHVGMAMGNGTDVAIESADVVLMKDDLNDVIRALQLSSATIRNVKQNLFWAFFYNIIGIPIAAGLLYPSTGLLLNPMIAAAAMSFSSVSVVTNALRLKGFKAKINTEPNTESNKPLSPPTPIVTPKEVKMKKELKIEGMTCMHCVGRVDKTLNGMEGISNVQVDLEKGLAHIEVTASVTDEAMIAALDDQGYAVTEIH